MRTIAAVFSAAALSLAGAPAALSAPAEQSPLGGPGSHTHHVHTGSGGCNDIDSVAFEPADHGLHQGASQSGAAHGPWHGTCAAHIHATP